MTTNEDERPDRKLRYAFPAVERIDTLASEYNKRLTLAAVRVTLDAGRTIVEPCDVELAARLIAGHPS